MRKFAAVIVFLILAAGKAGGQVEGSGPYVISGLVATPFVDFHGDFEIRILTDAEVVIGKVTSHTQQPFSFRVGSGNYIVDVDVPGFQAARRRVHLSSSQPEVNVPILLEQQNEPLEAETPILKSEESVVNVREAPPSGAMLKELKQADKKFQNGDIDGAQSDLESLVRAAPNFYDGHKALGSAYQRNGRYRDSEKEFEAARDLRPASADPLILISGLHLEELETTGPESSMSGGLDKIQAMLTQAVDLDPNAAFAYYLLGITFYKMERYSQSEENLLNALKLSPRLGDVRLALANLYVRVGDWTRSLTNIDEYLKKNPRAANRDAVLEMRKRIQQMVLNTKPS
jgi:predicted Zn-dependent protease